MFKRILIATGGTGGHVYPAVAFAQQVKGQYLDADVLFIGGNLAQNRYFAGAPFAFRSVSCGAFLRKSPVSVARSLWNIAKGIRESSAVIKEFKPDVAVGFGSYYAFPPLAAAKLHSVPILLHEANSIPGKVNRLLAPFALATGVQFPHTAGLLRGKAIEVGMPLREGFKKGLILPHEAKKHFGLLGEGTTILAFGGSQGAELINTHVYAALKQIRESMPVQVQVIHIAGNEAHAEVLRRRYRDIGVAACVKPFETRMDLAWQAADCVISRAGACSIAEQLEFEVPGILVPFARAADNHQSINADFLVFTVGGAMKIEEKEMDETKLGEALAALFQNEAARLKEMRAAMGSYKQKARNIDLLSLLAHVLG